MSSRLASDFNSVDIVYADGSAELMAEGAAVYPRPSLY